MKGYLKDVLFVAPEQLNYKDKATGETKSMWRVKVVDDKGTYETLEIGIEMDKLGSLPMPRTRVDVEFDLSIRNYKTYLNNPVLVPLKG